MKLAISNLSWVKKDDTKVVEILRKYDVSGIELALSKIWKHPTNTSEVSLRKYKKFWNNNGIEIVATTSLLFGRPELTIFENVKTRRQTLDYLKKTAQLTEILGGGIMMFGSPKNRIKGNLSEKDTLKIAAEFFGDIANTASKYRICFAIEPTPPIYGGDFILTTKEAVELVKKVKHKNFGINLDASAIASNKDNYDKTVKMALPYICHTHISEPYLKPIPSGDTDHKAFARALKKYKYNKWLSIEMPLTPDSFDQIKKSLEFVSNIYH